MPQIRPIRNAIWTDLGEQGRRTEFIYISEASTKTGKDTNRIHICFIFAISTAIFLDKNPGMTKILHEDQKVI